MRRSTILEGKDVVSGVVVASEKCPLFILQLSPFLKCRSSSPIYRDRLIGIVRLAAGFVPRVAANYDPVVMHSDLARIQVDVVPPEAADLAASYSSGELKQEKGSEAVVTCRLQERPYLLGVPHCSPRTRTFRRLYISRRIMRRVPPRDGIDKCTVDHCMYVPHGLRRQPRMHLLRSDAGVVPAYCSPGSVNRCITRLSFDPRTDLLLCECRNEESAL